jgi:uncharacterized protein YpmB
MYLQKKFQWHMNIIEVIFLELALSFIPAVQVTSSASEATCDQGRQRAKLNSQLLCQNQLPYFE